MCPEATFLAGIIPTRRHGASPETVGTKKCGLTRLLHVTPNERSEEGSSAGFRRHAEYAPEIPHFVRDDKILNRCGFLEALKNRGSCTLSSVKFEDQVSRRRFSGIRSFRVGHRPE